MALSLSQFRANVTDFARPNRFLVSLGDIVNDIPIYGNNNSAPLPTVLESYDFLAKSAQIPGRTSGDIQVPWQGRFYKIAGDDTFDDITLTFHNNYEWDIRKFFEDWSEMISQIRTNERSAPGVYKSDNITLHQLGRTEGDIIASYVLFGAYPSNVSPIDLSMDSMDTVSDFTVTIRYDEFTRA